MSFFIRVVGVGPGTGGGGGGSIDGNTFYVVDYDDGSVYQYSTTTDYDVSTGSYGNISFDASSETSSPSTITWNNDGSKFYMDSLGSIIYQYSTTTDYDVSTGSYDNVSFDASSVSGIGFIGSINWNNDGTKLFMLGGNNDSIYEYSVSTAYDLGSTVSYNDSFDVSGETPSGIDVSWNNDGSKFYLLAFDDIIYQYSTTTDYDVSTGSYDNITFSTDGETESTRGMSWNNDGSKFYIADDNSNNIYEYSVGTAYDLGSTVSYNDFFDVSGEVTTAEHIGWDVESETEPQIDGDQLYMVGQGTDSIYEYSVDTAYDLGSAVSYTNNSADVSSEDGSPVGIAWNNDGTKFYMVGFDTASTYEYSVSTAYDLSSTVSYTNNSVDVSSEDGSPVGIAWNNDGTKFYMVGSSNDSIYEYSVGSAYDLGSTVSYTNNSADVSSEDSSPIDIAWNNDGTKFYMVGSSNDSIYEYSVSTAYDLSSTVSYTNNSVDVSSEDGVPYGIAWNNDGTKFYMVGFDTTNIYEYSVGTAYDLGSTVSYTNNSADVSSEDGSPSGIAWDVESETV